jgi:hypothetical protein
MEDDRKYKYTLVKGDEEVIKTVICIKGNGSWVTKGKTYPVIEESEFEYRVISNKLHGEIHLAYIHKSRFKDIES